MGAQRARFTLDVFLKFCLKARNTRWDIVSKNMWKPKYNLPNPAQDKKKYM